MEDYFHLVEEDVFLLKENIYIVTRRKAEL